ncbi:MAG: hypothetical protein MZV70_67120 [Desulfobacterales bacterium]|nr:hypothetical protein [Desulfobacterales bacterium]
MYSWAVSEDGGETFTNFKVSESPFLLFSTVFFGHYLGLTAHNDHVFPVWNRMDDGENSLLGAIVDPAIIGTGRNSTGSRSANSKLSESVY